MRSVLATLSLATLLGLAPAQAQQSAPAPQPPTATAPPAPAQPTGRRDLMAACRSDFKTLCNDASGLGARLQCLRDNRAKLSPDCSSVINAVLGTIQAKAASGTLLPRPMQACQQDLASLCPDLGKGEPGRMKCLRDNSAKLSPGCADAIKSMRDQAKSRLQTCEADRARLCGSVGKQAREQIECLRAKEAELSADCRQAVATARAGAKRAQAKGDGALPPAKSPAPAQVAPPASPPPTAAPPATPQAAPAVPAPKG